MGEGKEGSALGGYAWSIPGSKLESDFKSIILLLGSALTGGQGEAK